MRSRPLSLFFSMSLESLCWDLPFTSSVRAGLCAETTPRHSPASVTDEKAVYCRTCFGIHGNRSSQHDHLRHSSSRSGSCIGRYCGRTPFPAPRQDFSSGPLLFLGNRDNALVRFLCILVSFQYARGVEQHRDGRSALGLLRARFTASPRNLAFTCPATRRFPDK